MDQCRIAQSERPMNRLNKLSLSVLTLVITISGFQMMSANSDLHAAEVYSWVDNNGTKHYSDKPFKYAKKLSFSVATPKKEIEETAAEEPELFDIKDEARLNAECTKAQTNIANLLKGGKLMQKNAEGKDVELTIEQMNTRLSESQAYVRRYCTKVATNSESVQN